jgi:uncharacterized phage-associated protein
MHNTNVIVNEFLIELNRQGLKHNALGLTKLIYIANGWMLALFETPLIKEHFIVGKYGPVLNSTYNIKCINVDIPLLDNKHANALNVIKKVVSEYGNYNDAILCGKCNYKDSAWDKIKEFPGKIISSEQIKNEYNELRKKLKDNND